MNDGFKQPKLSADKEAMDVEKAVEIEVGKDKTDEIARVQTNASNSELPFSKARTVALVATVAAAPFLSVGGE